VRERIQVHLHRAVQLRRDIVADFGLYHYVARFYDPQLGRFAQADTVTPGGVQGLDRYAGMANNTVRYTDPTGHNSKEDEEENTRRYVKICVKSPGCQDPCQARICA